MEVLDEKESLPDGLKYGIRLCGSKKVVDQILENSCGNVVQTRLRHNPKTKLHFIEVVIKVPKTSEQKKGRARVGGTGMGNTPFCTFLSGSTAEYFNEDILEQDGNKNGGRKLLFEKARKIIELQSTRKKVVGKTQRNPVNSKPTYHANAQAVSTVEEEFETTVL